MELFITLTEPVCVGNVTYSPGSKVRLTDAIEAGLIDRDSAAALIDAEDPGTVRQPPRNASAPGRNTRARTGRQTER